MKKLAILVAPLLLLIGVVGFTSVARADDGTHTFSGVVSNFNKNTMTFTLVTKHSGNIMVTVDEDTQYTDRDHSIRHFSDIANGVTLKIRGDFSDKAKVVDDVNKVVFRYDDAR